MKERPILFSAPMVRAILEGRKSQTRRAIKGIPWRVGVNVLFSQARAFVNGGDWRIAGSEEMTASFRCPYGVPGDRLWVRETWCGDRSEPSYRATAIEDGWLGDEIAEQRWRPSIHMPRWASRILLEVTDVRVERLQNISDRDAAAEGVDWKGCPTKPDPAYIERLAVAQRIGLATHCTALIDYVAGYRALWESINGAGSWDANPWVWVVAFRRIDE